jgi:nucleoside-diphosphate-sugar epimerase
MHTRIAHQPISSLQELEDRLSEPTPATVEAMARLKGDIVVLGVGGKMGPTLARMARRASAQAGVRRRIIGVSRFSFGDLEAKLNAWDVETHPCDLLNAHAYKGLPDADNVVFMVGMKFGSANNEAMTWAMNTHVPALIAERYRDSRIAAFSTGNVYGLSPIARGGSIESDELCPVGEYAMSCLGRERIFEHFSRSHMTPVSIIRLNYATELRYGVLVDIARRVKNAEPVPLSMGYLNAIWQADASAMSLQALQHASSPPFILNIAGPETLSVRRLAEQFASSMNLDVSFTGMEAPDALLSNAQRSFELFGYPSVTAAHMVGWIADWVSGGGESLSKPTHFESRAGRF